MFGAGRSPMLVLAAAAVLAAVILIGDLMLPLGVAGGVPYVAVVGLGWWLPKRRQIFFLALISSALVLAGYLYSPPGGIAWVVVTNRLLALFAIWITAALLFVIRKEERTHQRFQTQARNFETRLIDALESLEDGVALYDADDRFVFCNSKYRTNLAAIDHMFVPGTPFEDVLRAVTETNFVTGSIEDPETYIRKRMARHRNLEPSLLHLAKTDQWVMLREYRTSEGGTLIIRADITQQINAENEIRKARDELELRVANRTKELMDEVEERKRVEENLRRAKEAAEYSDRAKGEFLANMSHELRTPLNSIIGFSDILKSEVFGAVGNPRYKDYFNDINVSGRHLLDLIKDILDVSKIEAGAMDMVDERVDLAAAVKTSIRMVSERAERGRVAIHVDIPSDLPGLRGDTLRIKQILLNLIGNAVKFTPPDGQITIIAGQDDGGGLFVTVGDTGVGIDADDLGHVTEPFAQAAGPLTRGHEGTGLGLALVKSFVELHDGALEIESEPGKGTRVTARFTKDRTLTPQAVKTPANGSAVNE